jgi:hypothetical protein
MRHLIHLTHVDSPIRVTSDASLSFASYKSFKHHSCQLKYCDTFRDVWISVLLEEQIYLLAFRVYMSLAEVSHMEPGKQRKKCQSAFQSSHFFSFRNRKTHSLFGVSNFPFWAPSIMLRTVPKLRVFYLWVQQC